MRRAPVWLTLLAMATWGAAGAREVGERWDGEYPGGILPESMEWPWHLSAGANTRAELEGDALRVVDAGRAKGELRFYSRGWDSEPGEGGAVEARVRVRACDGRSGVILLLADGAREWGLTLYPDRIESAWDDWRHPVDMSAAARVIGIEACGTRLRVSVDGAAVRDDPAGFTREAHRGRNLVGFGSLSSAATGEALWERVSIRAGRRPVALVVGAEHVIVYKRPGVYACFPSLRMLEDGALLTSFGTRTVRSHIDGTGGGARRISRDGGRTWGELDGAIPDDPFSLRSDGGKASAHARGWREVPKERAAEFEARGYVVRDVRPGTVAYLSGARAILRRAGERADRQIDIAVPPRASLMSYNTAARCRTGRGVRLVAVYGRETPGEESTSYVLRSDDEGERWECLPIARPISNPAVAGEMLGFGETALVELPDGRLLAMMRPDPDREGHLWQSLSADGGKSWGPVARTPMWGYPAHLLVLRDGRVLCTYGYRRAPMGIRACVTRDASSAGAWEIGAERVLRADGMRSGSDLGYPLTAQLADGGLFTIYYFTCGDGVTHVAGTRWSPGSR